MKSLRVVFVAALVASGISGGCAPGGYINQEDLESRNQGPRGCAKSCEELGMRMTAMVLVGSSVPGCVCQPLVQAGPVAAPVAIPAPAGAPGASLDPNVTEAGAAASTGGFVVIAAAAAARQQQEQMQRQQRAKH